MALQERAMDRSEGRTALFRDTGRLLAGRPLVFATIGATAGLPADLLAWATGSLGAGGVPLAVCAAASVVLGALATPLAHGALAHAALEQSAGRQPSLSRAFRTAWRKGVALVGAYLQMWVRLFAAAIPTWLLVKAVWQPAPSGCTRPTMAALLFLVIGASVMIYLLVRWVFIVQAVLLDGKGASSAPSRSAEIATGNVGRVVGVMAILTVLAGAVHAAALVLPMMCTTIPRRMWQPEDSGRPCSSGSPCSPCWCPH